MTTSSAASPPRPGAFVWIWLADATEPVVAGRIVSDGRQSAFIYGKSYLGNPAAIAIYEPELPLQSGPIMPLPGLRLPGCIRDGLPDAWGRRVMDAHLQQPAGSCLDSEFVYMLESGSDRLGAIDFQSAADSYSPRELQSASLAELMKMTRDLQDGTAVGRDLRHILGHCSSLGGARPKAHTGASGRKFVAKFSSPGDSYSVVKAEFTAMRLAAACGIDAAAVRIERVGSREVLLVERFDRTRVPAGWLRRPVVCALTMLELDEQDARLASYESLAEVIRFRFAEPRAALHELFRRICFNILCGNTDDHARNHAAFWDGSALSLTPAYDISPQPRVGGEAVQAMIIENDSGKRFSSLPLLLNTAASYQLDPEQAAEMMRVQINAIGRNWARTCRQAGLTKAQAAGLARGAFLHPFAFEGLPERHRGLRQLAEKTRQIMGC